MKLRTLKPRISEVPRRLQPNVAERIRGRRLQRIRQQHFSERPLCVLCEAKGITSLATELDHIIPLHKGGRDDDTNRQGLCSDCHRTKTRIDLAP